MVFGKKNGKTNPTKIIEDFLKKNNFPVDFDEKLNQYRAKIKFTHKNIEQDFTYPFAITLLKDWVVTEVAIIDLKDTPSDFNIEKIYNAMLQANFTFPEVNYALYNSMVISLAWSKIDSLNIDNFESEFTGMMTGVEKFPEVATYAHQVSFTPPTEFSPMYQ